MGQFISTRDIYLSLQCWIAGVSLKTGQTLRTFSAKDGRRVVLRTPRFEDLDDCLEVINSLVDEGADIGREVKASTDEEADWLAKKLAEVEQEKTIFIVAEVDGRFAGSSEVSWKSGVMSHVGEVGIGLAARAREAGIGTELMKTTIEESRKRGFRLLVLHVFAGNERARHVYEKVGFRETGRIPMRFYRKGRYIDDIIMCLIL